MVNPIFKLKKSSVPAKVPLAVDLDYGELAINYTDGILYYKNDANSILSFTNDLNQIHYTAADFDSDLSFKTADNISNGIVNRYYSTTLFDSDLALKTSNDLIEGFSNLYYTTARADSDAKNAISVTDAGGDGSLSYNNGIITYTGPSATEVRSHLSATGDLTYNSETGVFSFVGGSVYTTTTFDSDFGTKSTTDLAEGSNLYYTTLRANNDFDTRLATKSTTNLAEGSNLYYTSVRVDSDIVAKVDATFINALTIDADTLGSQAGSFYLNYSNFTNTPNVLDSANVRNIFSASGDLAYNSTLGQFSVTTYKTTNFDVDFNSKTTTNLAEGTNLYYTTLRANNDFDTRLATKSTTNLAEGSNLYYTTARFDTRLATKSTTNLAEGTNLYYTTARADSDAKRAISVTDAGGDGSLTYSSGTGVITYTGPSASEVRAHFTGGTGVTITNGSVAIGQSVGTADDVTFGQVTSDSSVTSVIKLNYTAGYGGITNGVGGELWLDSDEQKGLSFSPRTRENDNPGVVLNVGQEMMVYVHNETGGPIGNGQVVYLSGTSHNGHPAVSLARANAAIDGIVGMATMDIPNGGHGWVTRHGLVRGIDTSGLTPSSSVYVSVDTAGEWTTTPVTVDTGYPYHIGKVIAVDPVNGSILVDPHTEHFKYLRIQDRLKVTGAIEGTTLALDSSASFALISQPKRPSYVEGTVWYDEDEATLANHTANSDFIEYSGQRGTLRGRNSTGLTILKGTPVYSAGVHIPGDPLHGHHPLIYPADATNVNAIDVLGIAAHDIADGAHGYVIARGWLDGIDTAALTSGSSFHLSAGGGFIQNAPTYPNYPVQLGTVLTVDSAGGNGSVYIDVVSHSFDQIRVSGDGRVDGSFTVGGNLTILGTQTIASQENISIGGAFNYFNAGDTIGEANTVFTGSGLNDAALTGHYKGIAPNQAFYVKIDANGTPDTFEWGFFDSATPVGTGIAITAGDQALDLGISINFNATTGHTIGDKWTGTASPVNVDTGWFTNRNTGATGVGYTHSGMFFDVSTQKFTLLSAYLPEPEGTINLGDPSVVYGTFKAGAFEGNLTGNVTGTASLANALTTGRNFSISGDITANAVSFDGTGNVVLSAGITAGSIINADINAAAAIVDTKLATISTTGKVQNSATTATNNNTGSTIVARDASGNFAAGTITATITGTVSSLSNHTTTNLAEGTNLYHTIARVNTAIDSRLSGSTGITYTAGAISITDTGVAASTYGSETNIPQLTVNAQGQITSVSNVAVNIPAGYTQVNFDSDVAAQSAELLTSIKTVDGAGSGLDADLLDGQEGSYYRINIYDNTGALLN